ncbi:UNKNOWN [Stylonychia lemnae]|uniref:Uncharacterized protein n=1 Tax=Stylonychia lemnae TaxID=5949 RepID=A0A077ZPT7_STYLE|nr:UNKNOWN [Stylonychia lemnae]|eukprot:CDW71474.1 UNKNOWN [Stylonychia lemnae]
MRSQKLSDFQQSIASSQRQLSPYGSIHQTSNEAAYYQMNTPHQNSHSSYSCLNGMNSNGKEGQKIQMEIQQRISEVRNKLHSKRQSGAFGNTNNNNTNASHVLSSSNLNANKSPLSRVCLPLTLHKINQCFSRKLNCLRRNPSMISYTPHKKLRLIPTLQWTHSSKSAIYFLTQKENEKTNFQNLKAQYLRYRSKLWYLAYLLVDQGNRITFQITNLYENNDNRISLEEQNQQKRSMFFEGALQCEPKQKENKESFHQYFSVQEKQDQNSKFQVPKMSIFSERHIPEANQDPFETFKKQSQSYQITENQVAQLQKNVENKKEDFQEHFDNFLKNNEKTQSLLNNNISTIRSSCGQNPNNQISNLQQHSNNQLYFQHTHHELFASFSSPNAHQEIFTLGDQQPQSEVKEYQEQRNSYVEVDESVLPNFFQPLVQSPTPKFSLQLDKDSLNHMDSTDSSKSIRLNNGLNQQRVHLMSDKTKQKQKIIEYAESTKAKNIIIDLTSQDKEKFEIPECQSKSKFHLNLDKIEKQASIIAQYTIQSVREQSKKSIMQNKRQHKLDDSDKKFTANDQILAPKPVFVRHQKSNSKPSMHFMSKLQYKNPMFQTHHDNYNCNQDEIYSTKEDHEKNNELEVYTNGTNLMSPLSDRLGQIDKLNVLSRTASMDHYLSNCTTFLRGQRFLSPSNKFQQAMMDGTVKTKEQIRDYFVKLLIKKFSNYKKSLQRESILLLRTCDQNLMQAKREKLNILVLIKSFLMKQDAISRWGKLRTKEIYKRKGYAIYNLIVVMSQMIYRKPFQSIKQTDQYKEILNPLIEERAVALRSKWCQKGAYVVWARQTKYKQLLRRRAQLTQRALYNVIEKNRIWDGFKQLNLNRLRRGSFNSLNLKIKEYLQNMSAAPSTSTLLSDSHIITNKGDPFNINTNKTKILKALSAHQLQMTISKIRNSKASFLFNIFKEYKQNKMRQMEFEKTVSQISKDQSALHQQIKQQSLKLQSLALKSIIRILNQNHLNQQRLALNLLKKNQNRCKGVQILAD